MKLKIRIPICEDMELIAETREHINAATAFDEIRGILINNIDDPSARKMLAALPDKR